MKVFDLVKCVVDAKSIELNGKMTPNSEKIEILEEYCNELDKVIDTWEGFSIDADVVGKRNLIVVSIEIAALTINEMNTVVFDLIDRSVLFAVGNSERNNLRIDFTFPSVWDIIK